RECAVCVGHAMRVFTLLHSSTAVAGGIEQFAGQALDHGLLIASTGSVDEPTDSQRLTTLGTNIHRNLVGRTTNTAGAHLEVRSDVIKRRMEYSDWFLLGLFTDPLQRAIDDTFRHGLLSVEHDGVHELADDKITKLWIRIDLALFCTVTSGHLLCLTFKARRANTKAVKPYFGRFAPYFERRCLRLFTPWVSSTPRMM